MKAKHLIYKTTNPGFDNIPSLTFNIKPLSSNWHELFSFRWGKFKFNIKQFLNMFGIMFYSLNSILFDIQVQHIIFSLRHFFRVREASSFFSFIQLKVHICLSTTFYKKKKKSMNHSFLCRILNYCFQMEPLKYYTHTRQKSKDSIDIYFADQKIKRGLTTIFLAVARFIYFFNWIASRERKNVV